MQSQMFLFKQKPILRDEKKGEFLKNEDGTYQYGKEEVVKVQGALRPIEFWEYVFPQESLQEVLAMQNAHKGYNQLRPEVNRFAWILRKMMGAKKIPDMPELQNKEQWQITQKYVPMNGMAVYALGIREDPVQDFLFGDHGYYQEGL